MSLRATVSARLKRAYSEQALLLAVVLIIGVAGAWLLLGTHAASPAVAAEVEQGTVTAPASVVSDSNASAGKAIAFGGSSPTPPPTGGSGQISTIWVVMMENTDWSTVKNNLSAMPYFSSLLPNYAHAEKYFSQNHPSLPNYITLESGNNQGLTNGSDLPATNNTSAQHLTTLLHNKGLDWKYWAENLPGNGTTCNMTDPGFPYSEDHNPFVYFKDVQSNTSYCIAHERPFTEFAASLSNPPAYNFIVPNDADQGEKCPQGGHSCSIGTELGTADTFMKNNIPKIMASSAYQQHGAIFILWDEAGPNSDPNTTPSGLVVVSPFAKKNYASTVTYNHGSTLRTEEEVFGVSPMLGKASTSTDFSDMFTVPL